MFVFISKGKKMCVSFVDGKKIVCTKVDFYALFAKIFSYGAFLKLLQKYATCLRLLSTELQKNVKKCIEELEQVEGKLAKECEDVEGRYSSHAFTTPTSLTRTPRGLGV